MAPPGLPIIAPGPHDPWLLGLEYGPNPGLGEEPLSGVHVVGGLGPFMGPEGPQVLEVGGCELEPGPLKRFCHDIGCPKQQNKYNYLEEITISKSQIYLPG